MSSQQGLYKVGTILFDFPVAAAEVTEEHGMDKVESVVLSVLKPTFGALLKMSHHELKSKDERQGAIRLYAEPSNGVTLSLRFYEKQCLVTATLDYDKDQIAKEIPYDDIKSLEKEMIELLKTEKKTKAIPELKRGLKHDVYFNTSDDRLIEYDVKEMLFDKKSDFQHIQIARSENYGNILILDGLVNLAESDLIYTQSLMWRGKLDYTQKNVLILGGGDGALLNELLKENPLHVTMVDIDGMVMESCRKHLQSACGNVLDTYKTDKYEIIVGDCVEFMNKCQVEGRKFEVIFGDLTDIPVSPTPQGEIWDFILKIVKLSFSILAKSGVYLTHVNGVSSAVNLEMFESAVLGQLEKPVKFSRVDNFVPSFMEKWVFYKIEEEEKA